MSLADLVYKNRKAQMGLASSAHLGHPTSPSVANVATVTVANAANAIPDNVPIGIRPDCIGALTDPDSGAPFLPWGPYVDPEDVLRHRTELAVAIEQLAVVERWSQSVREVVTSELQCASLWVLTQALPYFAQRLSASRTKAKQRTLCDPLRWQAAGLERCTPQS